MRQDGFGLRSVMPRKITPTHVGCYVGGAPASGPAFPSQGRGVRARGTCWDANRLDLDRVGVVPSPEFMSTEFGRQIASAGSIQPTANL